ncbi:hypothetical protein T265_03325 [Opisthorchis viverrini]|uniref:Nuclear pore complex protein Nup98-Nup96 n=1 Tax=Opisthorchis viverrini TaxID=6198 RepID=A0A075A3R3_OPIVI|nr:hypothetical protein T265_03325 [Opisthorchis viverrini]KER30165.1 hypothetical protein T265_03325 [Opisthorchis viverrini]
MFGAPKSTFGAPASSAFGQTTNTLFGAATKPTNLFGQPSVGLGGSGTTSLFGGGTTQQNTITWGSGATMAATASSGTAIAFNPPVTPDTIQRGGQQTQVNAKHMCITAMKEYQDKSLEELRLEDYVLNRRSGNALATATTGTSLFGTSATVKPFQFGASQTTTTASSIFGQTNKPTSSLFGGSGLSFGASSTTTQPVFGQPAQTQGSLLGVKPQFGTTQQSTNLFGAAAPAQTSGFTFGQTAQTNSPFGTKPLFGGTTGVTGGTGLFGTAQQASTGTTGFTFGQPQATGLGATTNLFGQTATSTAATGGQLNLFGAQPSSSSVLPFGSTQQTTNLFGAVKTTGAAPLFGTPSTALGTTQQTGFGAFGGLKPGGTTSLFGAATSTATSKPGGIFGIGAASNTSTGFGFGAATATGQTPAFGAFGAGTSTTGLFGQTNANTLAAKKPFEFGSSLTNPTVSSTGLFGFGQTTSQAGGLFGGASIGSTALGLGSAAGGTGTLFGQTTGFGSLQKPAAPGFGPGFGLGGGTGLGAGGLFGTTSTALGSLSSAAQPLGSGFGGIGTLQSSSITGGLTGLSNTTAEQFAQNVRAQQQVLDLVRSMPYGQSSLFRYLNMPGTSETGTEDVTKQCAGTESNSGAVVPARAAASALAQQHKAAGLTLGTGSPSSLVAGIVGRGTRLRQPSFTQRILKVSNRSKLFSGFYEDDAFLSPSGQNVSPALRLRRSSTLSDGTSLFGSPDPNNKGSFFVRRDDWRRLHLPESVRTSILERSAVSSQAFTDIAENSLNGDHTSEAPATEMSESAEHRFGARAAGDTTPNINANRSTSVPHTTTPLTPSTDSGRSESHTAGVAKLSVPFQRGLGMARAREALQTAVAEDSVVLDDLETTWTSPVDMTNSEQWTLNATAKSPVASPKPKCGESEPRAPSSTVKNSKAVLKLTKPGYYTLPTLEELEALVDSEGQCVVEDFVVGRRHYGHILFPGNTELTDLDLDSIVHIRRREVVVYPDDEKKPPVGCGLNKRAEICLESIWPTDKATREPIKSPERLGLMRFEERLERATRRMDARFIEYRPESGSWVFEVKHFSKYRLEDSDNEDVDVFVPKTTTTTESPQVDSKLPQSKDEYIKTAVLQTRTTTTTPQLKAVGALITEADSDMRFSPTHFGSFTFKDSTGLGLKTMELTNLTPDTTTIQEDDARSVSASVKQMRDVFFSPVFIPKVKPGRASSVLYRHGTGELSDEADEFEAAEYSAVWPIAGTKRFQASQSPELPLSQTGDMAWVGQAGGDSQFCPASGMLGRTHIRTATIPSKRERLSDDSDESAVSDEPITSRASFRPIPYEPFSDGVPLSTTAVPPITSGLHLARIPAQLKSVNELFSGVGSELKPCVYPYFALSKCISDQTMARSVKTSSKTRSIATKLFSSMLIDVGLNRGHGFRPCWGQIRFRELHTVVLATVTPAVRGSGAFNVSFSSWPSLIVQDDEDLLNTAMSTSECTTLSGSSEDPELQPPVDHCPQWQPVSGLKPLETYASTLQCTFPQMFESSEELKKPRTLVLCRLISLCMALWGRHPQEVASHAVVGGGFQKPDKDGTGETSECELTPEQLVPDNLESATEDDAENQLSEDNPPQHHTESRYILQLARKQALSEWIRAQSFPWLKNLLTSLGLFDSVKDLHTASSNSLAKSVSIDRIAHGIFACLVAGEPGAGCRLALSAGMPELATLVAQSSSGDPVVRRCLQHQLLAWHQTEYDGCIPLEVLRIYALLAGQPRIPHPKVHDAFIEVLEQLDWIRVFGAHLWYLTDYTADLAEVLRIYSAFWHSINSTCSSAKLSRPTPPHQRDLISPPKAPSLPTDFPTVPGKDDIVGFRNWPRDSAYHLIQLFCHTTHSLERTLDPCSISRFEPSAADEPTCRSSPDSLLDWSASWHLWRTLHALGYRHFSSPSSVSRICGEFASQLEDAGLWEWAIFVLLHLPDQTMRDACVKAVVARHASLVIPIEQTGVAEEDSREYGRFLGSVSRLLNSFKLAPPPSLTRAEQFVVKLGVPSRWIYEAKAILARQRFNECNRGFTPDQLVLNSRNAADYAGLRLRARLFALLETAHWFASGYYGEAQKVCVEYLLPDIVLHTNLSIACGCVGPSVGTGLFLSVTRLGHQLNRLLSPYRTLSTGHLPCRFEEGVGVYLRYSDILCLADELAALYQSRSNTQPPDADQSDENNETDESESRARLALVLSNLNTQLDTFMGQLHLMDTPNLNSRVVKTEIAVTCAKMISAFLSGLDPQSDMLVHLRRHLMSLVKINLPADYRLQELSTLSEAELSLGAF